MIKFENTEVTGWEAAIRGMRNPMNSWEQSDSGYGCGDEDKACKSCEFSHDWCGNTGEYKIGEKDLYLMKRLVKAGSDHGKFMRMINVTVDITAPLYWWKEFDTYKVGTVRNSCSTMHTIYKREFTIDDFSHEHLFSRHWGDLPIEPLSKNPCFAAIDVDGHQCWYTPLYFIDMLCAMLNRFRELYNKEDNPDRKKQYWYQMIQLLPSSYNQRATIQMNYAVLRNMYHSRKNHKLDEWSIGFVEWVESLPYHELITD